MYNYSPLSIAPATYIINPTPSVTTLMAIANVNIKETSFWVLWLPRQQTLQYPINKITDIGKVISMGIENKTSSPAHINTTVVEGDKITHKKVVNNEITNIPEYAELFLTKQGTDIKIVSMFASSDKTQRLRCRKNSPTVSGQCVELYPSHV